MSAERALQPSGFVAFRACALPMSVLTEWVDGTEAATATPDILAAAIERDLSLLRGRLDAIANRPEVRLAMAVASPDLVDALRDRGSDPGVEAALVRYVVRMASRPTPYGLFAACGTGSIGARTEIVLPDPTAWRRHTQLDANYLDALVRDRVTVLRDRLLFRPNDSLHLIAGRWRYVESRIDGLERSYHLVEIAESKHLQRALEAARAGSATTSIVEAVAAGGVDSARASDYIDQLVDAQVLVPNLAVTITGPLPLDALIDDLQALGDEETAGTLRAVRDEMAAVDAEGPAASTHRHEAIAEQLIALSPPIDRARLLHVDAIIPSVDSMLASATVDDILRGVNMLRRITPPRTRTELDLFRDAFRERYEGQEVPLLDALDEELGIRFGPELQGRDPSPLLKGLRPRTRPTRETTLGARERHLLELLHTAWAQGAHEVRLTNADIDALANDDAPPLPDALAATAVLAQTVHGPRIVLDIAVGPSGARLLGRFCYADPELERHVRAHLAAEEALDPDALHAEVVHLPTGRMVNVLARPTLRSHEIEWLGRSGLTDEQVIPASDLLLSLPGDRFVLRSQTLGHRVVPRLTSAHNYDRRSPGVYRFLAALQSDGVIDAVGWSWSPFEQLPFTPRVRWGSLVLARARWWVTGSELRGLDQPEPAARWTAVQTWRARRGLPRRTCLVEGDNVLAFDFDNVLSVDTFVRAVRRGDDVLLEELFPGPDELVGTAPDGQHAVELVVPFVRSATVVTAPSTSDAPVTSPTTRRVFPPGAEWSYLKLYTGTATADRLLLDAIAPAARQLISSGAADCWFFLRYADPGFHLRVRIHGDPDEIRPALDGLIARAIGDGRAHDALLGTYNREIERYGGAEGVLIAERLFHADSDAVVDLLDLFEPGDVGHEARWQIGLLGVERLLQDLGLDEAARANLSRGMRDDFDRELHADARLHKAIGHRARAERPALEALLAAAPNSDHLLALGIRVLAERSARISPLAAELVSLRGAGRLALPIDDLASSFAHMWLNRLCRSQNRFQEYVIYALLARLYEARAFRARAQS